VKVAERAGYRIKLLGRTVRMPGGGRTAYVAPHLIPEEHPMANVEDVFNAIVVRGNATGEVMFYGKGAGEMPTASACVSDVMEAVSRGRGVISWSSDEEGFVDPKELHTRFYFRIEGSLTDAAMAFGQVEVLSEDGETAFLTERISGSEAEEQSAGLNVLARMRVLG
jgi:homoserine dehydrogenase